MSDAPLGVKLVAFWYGIGGALAVLLGGLIIFAGFQFPLSSVPMSTQGAVVPMGVFGLAVFGAIGAVPLLLGIFMLLVAAGLWHEKVWALWTTVGLNALSLLLLAGLLLVAGALSSIPFVGQYFGGEPLEWLGTAALNALVLGYLLLRRGEFKE